MVKSPYPRVANGHLVHSLIRHPGSNSSPVDSPLPIRNRPPWLQPPRGVGLIHRRLMDPSPVAGGPQPPVLAVHAMIGGLLAQSNPPSIPIVPLADVGESNSPDQERYGPNLEKRPPSTTIGSGKK